jgi:hypothetical protein
MNSDESFECTSSGPAALSRRSAVLRLGSGGLVALLASGVIPTAAQEASPMAGTPVGRMSSLASTSWPPATRSRNWPGWSRAGFCRS